MENSPNQVTCHWLTPTRLMPFPYGVRACARPWSCMRDGSPRPLDATELHGCAACARWEPRTFDAVQRDLMFEVWGVGDAIKVNPTFDDTRRALVMQTWGIDS